MAEREAIKALPLGSTFVSNGVRNEKRKNPRTCRIRDCHTVLSLYNPGVRCSVHAVEKVQPTTVNTTRGKRNDLNGK